MNMEKANGSRASGSIRMTAEEVGRYDSVLALILEM
jgi:hypothetical protein